MKKIFGLSVFLFFVLISGSSFAQSVTTTTKKTTPVVGLDLKSDVSVSSGNVIPTENPGMTLQGTKSLTRVVTPQLVMVSASGDTGTDPVPTGTAIPVTQNKSIVPNNNSTTLNPK
jgi:hypothetical protein